MSVSVLTDFRKSNKAVCQAQFYFNESKVKKNHLSWGISCIYDIVWSVPHAHKQQVYGSAVQNAMP